MKKVLCLLSLALITGCAGVKTMTVRVTEPRPAISVNDVQVMLNAPTNAVLLADIYAESSCSSKEKANAAQADLKKEAAAIGANALVIQRWEPTIDYSSVDDHFRIEANAYFVP